MKSFLFTCIVYAIAFAPFTMLAQDDFSAAKRNVGNKIDSQNFTSLAFDKSLNTYHWTSLVFYKNSFGPLSLQLNEQYLSTLIKTDRKLITDNQSFDLRARYLMTNRISVASYISSFILSDNKNIGSSIGKASSHAVYGGIVYRPIDQFTIEPMVGIRLDNQIDQHDHGTSYILGLSLDTISSYGYISKLDGSFQYDKIDPRLLETHRTSTAVEKYFSDRSKNILRFNYYSNRRDFYFPADSSLRSQHNISYNIESRTDNAYTIGDTLDYDAGEKMFWTFRGTIFTREITRNQRYTNIINPSRSPLSTVINELKIEGSVRGTYLFSNTLKSSFIFSYLERDEKHKLQFDGLTGLSDIDRLERIEERKNNHARRTSLASTTDWNASASDTVSISASANILRYDTPSDENDDDRDELWYLINLSSHHRFNQYLSLRFNVDVSLTHLVYLFASRSADNNWNRIIRLSPRLEYRPWKQFSTSNIFEVLANYTVYDYEYGASLTRSFAFRQFAFIDSSVVLFTNRLAFGWLSHVRLYERGELQWNAFAERPLNYFEEKTFLGNLRYILHEGLLLTIGIRYFSQLRFSYSGTERNLENFLRSMGPTTSIEVTMKGRTALAISGWYERQAQTGQIDRGFTTMMMTINYQL